MKIDKIKKRAEKLRKLINYHRDLYHIQNQEKISIEALDSLKKELFNLETKYPSLITKDSPTQRVAGQPLKEFQKIKHYNKMHSLNDAFSETDMEKWGKTLERFLKIKKKWDYFCELKIDGLAVELIYKNGIFIQGSTRGDGFIGEDVTQNLKTIKSIPLKIQTKEFIVVYGEIFISFLEFEKINKIQKEKGLTLFSNPRNLAAGSLRQLDPKITQSRNLSFIAYDIVSKTIAIEMHQDKHFYLKKIGFKEGSGYFCKNLKEVFDFYKIILNKRKNLEYSIDGIVILVNENFIFEKLGVTGKATRGAIAYKFPLKKATTKVKNIIIQVGRSGVLTPVAELKPVDVDGVMISKASLYNQNEIRRLNLQIGDTVIVGRAGDVVPTIIKTLPELRDGSEKKFIIPKTCPYCDSTLKEIGTEKLLYCTNKNCFEQIKRKLYHFVSKDGFDIDGCGPKIIDKLLETNLINNPADFFDLKAKNLIKLEGFSDLASKNLIQSINKSKNISFYKLIYSLGIPGVGSQAASKLTKFLTIKNLEKAYFENLKEIKDIGPIVAQSIINWFKNSQNKKILKKILTKININYPIKKENLKIKGKKFLFTGLFKKKREELKELVLTFGGEILSSVSSKLDYLVVGEKPSSKIDKAKKISTIKIISEDEFLNFFN